MIKHEGLICFDFDSTLGKVPRSTDQKMFDHVAQTTGIPFDLAMFIATQTKPFSLREFLYGVSQHTTFDQVQLYQQLHQLVTTECSGILYSDALPTLDQLRQQNHKLAVITYGGTDYQTIKLSATGLNQKVDDTRITEEYLSKAKHLLELKQKYQPHFTIFVDDKVEELEAIQQKLQDQVKLIHIIRSDQLNAQSSIFSTISNLTELLEHLR
jgi:FMN phosphatase YigB (HAD superfamily)